MARHDLLLMLQQEVEQEASAAAALQARVRGNHARAAHRHARWLAERERAASALQRVQRGKQGRHAAAKARVEHVQRVEEEEASCGWCIHTGGEFADPVPV